jgi:hypothetical protein
MDRWINGGMNDNECEERALRLIPKICQKWDPTFLADLLSVRCWQMISKIASCSVIKLILLGKSGSLEGSKQQPYCIPIMVEGAGKMMVSPKIASCSTVCQLSMLLLVKFAVLEGRCTTSSFQHNGIVEAGAIDPVSCPVILQVHREQSVASR